MVAVTTTSQPTTEQVAAILAVVDAAALAMQADDVHVVPLTTWSNRKSDWVKTPPPKQMNLNPGICSSYVFSLKKGDKLHGHVDGVADLDVVVV